MLKKPDYETMRYWESVTIAAMASGRFSPQQASAAADSLVEERARRVPPPEPDQQQP